MGDAIALDVRQGLALVELLHEHHGGAEVMQVQREAHGRGVIQRRSGQVDGVAVEAEHPDCRADHGVLGDLHLRQGAQDALRPAGGAGAVHHGRAQPLVRQAFGGEVGHGIFEARPAVDGAVHHQVPGAIGDQRRQVLGGFAQGPGADKQLGVAVLDDIGHFAGGEEAVDRHHQQTGTQRCPADLEAADVVLEEHREAVAAAQAMPVKVLGEAVGALVQFAIGQGFAAAGVDDCGLFRGKQGVVAKVLGSFHLSAISCVCLCGSRLGESCRTLRRKIGTAMEIVAWWGAEESYPRRVAVVTSSPLYLCQAGQKGPRDRYTRQNSG
ncbi:hypothetical protein D9M71_446020 [compost metagenome]